MQNIFKKTKSHSPTFGAGVLLAMTLALSACGGGGGEGPTLSLSSLQGRWVTTAGSTEPLAARWLPPSASGKSTASFWLLSNDGLFLTVLDASTVSNSGVVAKGNRYRLDPQSNQGDALAAVNWTGVANVNTQPNTMVFSNGPSLTLQDSLNTAALQSVAAATWRSDLTLTTLNLTVDALGLISGQTQGGCEYDGKLTACTDVNMYEATLKETCPYPQQVVQYTGIGFVSTSIDKLTLALVNGDSTSGKVLYFNKQ